MKIKLQRPRSCLGWFAWVFGILLVLFAISYTIDMIRLANAWDEAYTLAAKLGYTPERHLADQTSSQLANLLLVTAGCDVRVVFTTPLNPSDFAAHLGQAVALLADGSPTDGRNMYVTVPLIVNDKDAISLYHTFRGDLPPVYEHGWLVMNEDNQIKMRIFYSELSQAEVKIEYAGRPITENVAYVGVDAGEFPLWTWLSKCTGLHQ